MNLDIITPDESVFSGEITAVTVPGTEGMFQVLYNHAPIISTLTKGKIKIKTDGGEQILNADEGVIEVLNNKIIILVEKIDREEHN